MKLYKLTTQTGYTRNRTFWGKNVTYRVPNSLQKNPRLCSENVLHAYNHLNLGLIMNCIHARISNPIIWEAKGDVVVSEWDKCGCYELTTIRKIPYPCWYRNEKTRLKVYLIFTILCSEVVIPILADLPLWVEIQNYLEYFREWVTYKSENNQRKLNECANKLCDLAATDCKNSTRFALKAWYNVCSIPFHYPFDKWSWAAHTASRVEMACNHHLQRNSIYPKLDIKVLADEAVHLGMAR